MEIILAVIGLVGSAFFAGSEAAYTAFNKIRLDIWARDDRRFIKAALFFQKEPQDFFSTVLIGNNFSNILYTTFATVYLIKFIDESLAWLLITIVVVYWGEIFPKTLFRALADKIVLPILMLVRAVFLFFRPVVYTINSFTDVILKLLRISHRPVDEYFSVDEFHLLMHASGNEESEQKYIANLLHLKDVKVREAMIPRTDIVAVDEAETWQKAYQTILKSGYSYLLFYREDLDQITRAAFEYEFLEEKEDLKSIGRPVNYVPQSKSCAQLLKEFQRDNISIAVVVDEYGGTAGVVTLDDLIDEVFGEWADEKEIKALNQHSWLLNGRMELDLIEEALDLKFGNTHAETIAGLVLETVGQIPKPGQEIEYGNFRIIIQESSLRKITKVKIIKNLN